MNHKKKIRNVLWVGLLLFLCLAVILVGCAKPAPTPAKHLKFGAIFVLSGPISTIGISWARGLELYFDKVNEQGGVKIGDEQYLIDFIAEDDKLNPEVAATAAKKLVYEDGVNFIAGTIAVDAVTEAVYGVCEPNEVLHVLPWINVPGCPADISPDKPFCLRLNISADTTMPLNYDYLVENYPDAKRIVIVHPDIGYAATVESCRSWASERGLEIVSVEPFELGVLDFVPIYTRALAYEPDAVQALMSAQAQYQLRAARELGFKGPFFSDSPLGPDVILSVAGPEVSTDVFCNGWDPAQPTGSMRELIERWDAKYGETFVSDALVTWDAAWVFIQVLEKAQSLDPKKIVATFETMTEPGSFQTSYGPGRAGGLERFGVNREVVRPIIISPIMNGVIQTVRYVLPE